jgi:hypothetical protein
MSENQSIPVTHSKCLFCGAKCKVTKDGAISKHGHKQRGATNSVFCPGSSFRWNATYQDLGNGFLRLADRLEEVGAKFNRDGTKESVWYNIGRLYPNDLRTLAEKYLNK